MKGVILTPPHCNTLQHTRNTTRTLQQNMSHCKTLQRAYSYYIIFNGSLKPSSSSPGNHPTPVHYLKQNGTATHFNDLKHYCNTRQHTAPISNTTATNTTHCNNQQQSKPQRIAVHCSALQCVVGVCAALGSLPAFSFFLSHHIKALGIVNSSRYGVATISRLLKITGLFCKISSLVLGSFAKET